MFIFCFVSGGSTYLVFQESQSPEEAKKTLIEKHELHLRQQTDKDQLPQIEFVGIHEVKEGLIIGANFNIQVY